MGQGTRRPDGADASSTSVRVNRFDHAVIAVHDLNAAVLKYRELGFDVVYGGAHTGRGTHNAIIRFGLDYMELIAIRDRAEAIAANGNVTDLIGFLDATDGGLLGFALAASALEEIADAWSSGYAPATGPFAMERVQPDGARLKWALLIPGGSAWRKPWPFLIRWDASDSARRSATVLHRNGAIGVASLTVLTERVDALRLLYENDLGLRVRAASATGGFSAQVGEIAINVIEPQQVSADESHNDEGLFEVALAVQNIDATSRYLRLPVDAVGRIVVPVQAACGANLVFVANH